MYKRQSVTAVREDKKYVSIIAGEAEEYTCQVIYPIICEGDAIGAVALMGKDARIKMGEVEQKLAAAAAGFLGRQMESWNTVLLYPKLKSTSAGWLWRYFFIQ